MIQRMLVTGLTVILLLSASATEAPKKTSLDQKRLPYPTISSLAAGGRAQRHVPDSIPSLRARIAQAIVSTLHRCPCCCRGRF